MKGPPVTHPTRFLQTILAQPADDSPRLHYARWLDGCGNPLGEFIRLQCELARQPSLAYERREQELLAQHQSFWAHALTGRIQWCSFRRGFIEEVSLTDRQLVEHADELFRYAPVLDLHLQWTGLRLDKLPELPGIQHTLFLDLSSQRLGSGAIERLAEAPLLGQVHGLNLSSNLLEDEGLEAIYESPYAKNLRELYVSDNPLTDDSVRRLVLSPRVDQFEVLDMRFTQITKEGIATLKRGMRGTVLV